MHGKIAMIHDQYWMGDQVNIQTLAAGAYIVELNDDIQFLRAKFVKY